LPQSAALGGNMAKDTPSIAKNKIKRSLGAICDPHPSKKEEKILWEYFHYQCAYCGIEIERESRTGHLQKAERIAFLIMLCRVLNVMAMKKEKKNGIPS
jgi:hypothetical protein